MIYGTNEEIFTPLDDLWQGVNELCDQWRFRVPLAGFGTELVFILGRYGLEGLAFVEIGGEWV